MFKGSIVALITPFRDGQVDEDALRKLVNWHVEQGSALDCTYLQAMPRFDIVYSWGVLHHTGSMWLGIENAISRVAEEGQLFIAIYNDQGSKSHGWWLVKYIYTKLPRPINIIYAFSLGALGNLLNVIKYTLKLNPMAAIKPLLNYKKRRGMSLIHDMIDWMGGFPYEFARYELLADYMSARGFRLERGKAATSLGCHEMVFRRLPKSSTACVE